MRVSLFFCPGKQLLLRVISDFKLVISSANGGRFVEFDYKFLVPSFSLYFVISMLL